MVADSQESGTEPHSSTLGMPLSREALYELVWSEPMLKIATRFGVSSPPVQHGRDRTR